MNRAAIGVRVHSGWSVLVGVSDHAGSPEILERKHITIIDPAAAGTKQPYHFAEKLTIQSAERHLANCAAASERLAQTAVGGTLKELRKRGYGVTGCALLRAAGRSLPALPDILASHALIHTAEGEFFRKVMRNAFEHFGIGIIGFRERDLDQQAVTVLGKDAHRVVEKISNLGRMIGPPWTKDEKSAAVGAWLVLNM